MNNHLNLYYIFYEVATIRNISKAAKELYISQPAISKSINKLESYLNCKLFIRNSRGVTLTTEGEMLYAQISNAFDAIEAGEDNIKKAKELGIGHLSIGVSNTLCKNVLLPYLKIFVNKNPHVKVSIKCQSSTETIDALEKGQLDIGLVGYPQIKNTLSYNPLMDIHDTFVTSPNYMKNFTIREKKTKDSIINNATFMMLNKENITRQYVDEALKNAGVTLNNIIEVSNMELLIDFAKTDLGISCVLREFVLNELNEGSLIEVNSIVKSIPRKIGLAYLPQKLLENSSAQKFLELTNAK